MLQRIQSFETTPSHSATAGVRLHVGKDWQPTVPEAVRAGLAACSRHSDACKLTRDEMAAVFGASAKTIYRWERKFGIAPERANARVLRYDTESVVRLVAVGADLNYHEAERLGLNPKAVIALASELARAKSTKSSPMGPQAVLVAENDEDRLLIAAWHDAKTGPTLRKILRGLLEQPPAAA